MDRTQRGAMSNQAQPLYRMRFSIAVLIALLTLGAGDLSAQRITSPKDQFGHNFGDDYWLANYQQIAEYWKKLDSESDRMIVKEIGKTAEGRPHLMAIVTSRKTTATSPVTRTSHDGSASRKA
jgi:hypothetical protein